MKLQKGKVAIVLICVGIIFLSISVVFLIWDINTSLTTKSTFSMLIYNFDQDAWERISFSNIITPIGGITILNIGIVFLVLGFMGRLRDSKSSNSEYRK